MKQPSPSADLGIRLLYYKTNKTFMKEKYKTAAPAFFALVDLKVGDKVKVLYKAESHQWGWDAVWNDKPSTGYCSMSDFIGQEGTVTEIWDGLVNVSIEKDSYYFPFYVIQPSYNIPEAIFLNAAQDYKVTFVKNGDILVGGIDIEFDTLEDIYNKAKSLQ